jgi:hypothetical protein
MWQISQASLEVDAERATKMPFSGNCHSFDSSTLKVLNEVGAVYGLFKTDLPFRPDHYTCLFIGQTDDLRTRLLGHYNHPSIAGVTHFFAETSVTEQQRKLREKELIAEFIPPGNITSDGY